MKLKTSNFQGISNIFKVEFVKCEEESFVNDLATVWTFNEATSWRGEVPVDSLCYLPKTGNSHTLEPNTLEFSNYTVRVYAFEKSFPETYVMLGAYTLVVGASPIITSLNGGSTMVEVEANTNLELTFVSATYDPDATDKTSKKELVFMLFCVPSREESDLVTIADSITDNNLIFPPSLNLTTVFETKVESEGYSVVFSQRDCLIDPRASGAMFNVETSMMEVNGTELRLNESVSLTMQLFVVKEGKRSGKSQKLQVHIDLHSLLTIDVDTDMHAMDKALDALSDLAKQNPTKALSYVGNIADVINSKSDTAIAANSVY
jgi:hypothetical protein